MAGSEADKQPDEGVESSPGAKRPSLADFLKPPPRSKSSMPPAPEAVTVADVPHESPTKGLSELFSEAPVPRSRRRSSLLPPPSAASAPPAGAHEDHEPDEVLQPNHDREADEDHEADEDEADEDEADEDREADEDLEADDRDADESSDELADAEVALSVPPPLVSPRVARRVAIATGAALAVIALGAGVRKFRSKPAEVPMPSVSALALSADVPHAIAPTDDLDPQPDDTTDDLPVDEAKGLALRKEARAMLEAGRIDEGVATARRAIEANPGDPENYILLAAGLQDQGKWDEARQIFAKCMRQSGRAEKSECVYFATRGK